MSPQYCIRLHDPTSFEEFRGRARAMISARIAPPDVTWMGEDGGLFNETPLPAPTDATFSVPAAYVDLAGTVIHHRDGERFALLYELLWRLTTGERMLLSVFSDPLVYRLRQMEKAVRRDLHKMTAFLRFRKVADDGGERFVAWFEPQHLILRPAADFFVKRFTNMRWSVLTPDGAMHWDGHALSFGPGVSKAHAPADDSMEQWWRSYYRATFNPARANPRMMRTEMPVRYWKNLPEASLIPKLLAQAEGRTDRMIAAPPTASRKVAAPVEAADRDEPDAGTLAALRAEARGCQRCPLFCNATQTVFGEGPENAQVMFVGEQPGDQEDLAGKPFVGPAGQLFDRAMAEAGVDRRRAYVTNAVKHFKFLPRGKKRIHQKPNTGEIEHCRWWLDRELNLVRPRLVVALGGTAARSLTGKDVKITQMRGHTLPLRDGLSVLFTVHPSYLLRLPDLATQMAEYRRFVEDLAQVRLTVPTMAIAA